MKKLLVYSLISLLFLSITAIPLTFASTQYFHKVSPTYLAKNYFGYTIFRYRMIHSWAIDTQKHIITKDGTPFLRIIKSRTLIFAGFEKEKTYMDTIDPTRHEARVTAKYKVGFPLGSWGTIGFNLGTIGIKVIYYGNGNYYFMRL